MKVQTNELHYTGKKKDQKLAIIVENDTGKKLTIIVSEIEGYLEAKVYREQRPETGLSVEDIVNAQQAIYEDDEHLREAEAREDPLWDYTHR